MPPKQDLRGGKTSADSFAMSRSTFVVSMSRCFLAMKRGELVNVVFSVVHVLGTNSVPLAVERRFLKKLDIVKVGFGDKGRRYPQALRRPHNSATAIYAFIVPQRTGEEATGS